MCKSSGKRTRMLIAMMVLLVTGLAACGGGGGENEDTAATDDAVPSESAQPAASAEIPAGWTAAEFNDCSFAVPGDWNGDADAGVWWPGEGSMAMGRPATSLHTGGMPMLQGASFEDRIANRTNNALENRRDFTVAGMQAVSGNWTIRDKKYVGVFIKEEISADVAVAHFLDCRAPVADFPAYEEVFNNIIATFTP